MAYNYDALYADQPHALGEPTPAFVAFFDGRTPGRVLDVGCGQGRDALFIARAGHIVVAVDLSPAGIRDLTQAAQAEGLPITGHVADITAFTPDGPFDVILIDRTLHMLPDADQTQVLTGLLPNIAPDGWLLIADETANMPRFRAVLDASGIAWNITKDGKGMLWAHR